MKRRLQIVLVIFSIAASMYVMWPLGGRKLRHLFLHSPTVRSSPSPYAHLKCETLPTKYSIFADAPKFNNEDCVVAQTPKSEDEILAEETAQANVDHEWSEEQRKETWIVACLISSLVLVGGIKPPTRPVVKS